MAVRHRIGGHDADAPPRSPTPAHRWLSLLLGVVAVVALVVSFALFFGGMTSPAIVAAVVCVAAGWGRNQMAGTVRDRS